MDNTDLLAYMYPQGLHWSPKGNGYTIKAGNSFKVVYTTLLKGVFSEMKEFAPLGSKFFPFRADLLSEGTW